MVYAAKQRRLKFLGHVIRKGELEDLSVSVESLKSVQEVPSVLYLLTALNICTKILDNYGMLPETERIGKASLVHRGTSMIPKERDAMRQGFAYVPFLLFFFLLYKSNL